MSITRLHALLRRELQRALILCAAALAAGSAGFAAERVIVAGDPNNGTFYVRIERGVVPATDEWVAIAFYRLPSCVRADFNLLAFFDFANIPAIFFCPLTVHGFEIWDNGPGIDEASIQVRNSGNGAVPVWIVSRSDYDPAMPGLTLAELLAMPSLPQVTATFFEETLHPRGGARQSMIELLARGTMPDGRSFEFHLVESADVLRLTRIVLR